MESVNLETREVVLDDSGEVSAEDGMTVCADVLAQLAAVRITQWLADGDGTELRLVMARQS